jgi:hypothetical protein
MKVRRAIVSVHDKTGVVDLGRRLASLGIEILSTGGTASLLRKEGVPVREVAEVTGFPEMMDGRVKTLHPRIHGGILARRDVPAHLEALERHGIPPIDLVVVALYPFEATVAKSGVSRADVIEQIDIGGPTMIRAAAKNHDAVAVVTDPSQYADLLRELEASGGVLSRETRARLAAEAFERTARYDAAIADYLGGGLRPPSDGRRAPDGALLPAFPPSPRIARAQPALEPRHSKTSRVSPTRSQRIEDVEAALRSVPGAAVAADELVGEGGAPRARFVRRRLAACAPRLEHRRQDRPRAFHPVAAGIQRGVAVNRVEEQALVRLR